MIRFIKANSKFHIRLAMLSSLLCPAIATGQAPATNSSERTAAAEQLFQEGRQALERGDVDSACENFSKSARIEESPGTLLNLGACREKQGKVTSAWLAFSRALALAGRSGDQKLEEVARERSKKLAAILPKILIRGEMSGTLLHDGSNVDPAIVGQPFPVDPGTHEFQLKREQSVVWHVSVRADLSRTVTVDLPVATRDSRPAPNTAGAGASPPVLAYSLFGASIAAFAFGAFAGGTYLSAVGDFKRRCPSYDLSDRPICPPEARDDYDRASRWSTISTVSLIAGGVLGAAGAVAFVLRPSSKAPGTAVALTTSTVSFRLSF